MADQTWEASTLSFVCIGMDESRLQEKEVIYDRQQQVTAARSVRSVFVWAEERLGADGWVSLKEFGDAESGS